MRNLYIAAFIGLVIIASSIVYANKSASPVPVEKTPEVVEEVTPITTTKNLPLIGTEWVWLHTELPKDKMVSTPEREKYVLTLDTTKRVMSTTDCNTFIGKYEVNGEVLSFSPFTSTKKACSGSMESVYSKDLMLTTSYQITGERMYINLNRDAGRMVFEKK